MEKEHEDSVIETSDNKNEVVEETSHGMSQVERDKLEADAEVFFFFLVFSLFSF